MAREGHDGQGLRPTRDEGLGQGEGNLGWVVKEGEDAYELWPLCWRP